MPDIGFVRSEIARVRVQVGRQRREILQLQKAGVPTPAAEALLQRMLDKIDALCAERARLKAVLHVQTISVVIDQYAEAATGNRDYFLDKRHRSRGKGDVP